MKSVWRWNWGTCFVRVTFKDKCWRKRVSWISAISHLLWYGAKPSTDAVLSKTTVALQWFIPQVCAYPLHCSSVLVCQKEAFPLYFFFFNTFPSNHGQLTRGTRGSASVWSFPKNSGLLIKISSINDSFKPGGHNWKIRHYITLSMIWWSLRRPVVGHLRTPKHQNWERFIIEENPWLKWANFCL